MKYSKHILIKIIYIFMSGNTLFITNLFAEMSTTDRCATALKLMNVDTSGTNRGWAALCAGVVKWEPIARYGNWYGPGYWGGDTKLNEAGLKAPVDSLDEIAMHHDYGYVIAEKYGKIYGKQYEYKLKAMADKIAVRDSMKLPQDPRKWKKVPADIETAARYRDRIITGFIMESELYKNLGDATKIGDAVTSPFITWFDQIDYTHIPDLEKFEREVSSHINGWEKEVAKHEENEKKLKDAAAKSQAQRDKELKEVIAKEKAEKENEVKNKKEANEARERLIKKIEESKKEEVKDIKIDKKSYDDMSPQERRDALKNNDDAAWNAIEKELLGTENANIKEEQEEEQKSKDETSNDIPPINLTASGSFDEDYSSGKFKNIVTTTITLSFWNVGSQVSGYGGVTMKSKSVSSLNGSTSESKCSGTFSGGPNGVIRLSGECNGISVGVKNGQSISMDGLSLKVSNPSAFSYWER